MAEGGGQQVDLNTLTIEQLSSLRENSGNELESLSNSMQQLQVLVNRFYTAGSAVESLTDDLAGKPAMIPLASSLYVPGQMDDTSKVIVNVGTGYFIEMPRDKGVDFCRRKVTMLKDQLNSFAEVMTQKRRVHEAIEHVLGAKTMRRNMAAQQGAAGGSKAQ